MLGLCVAKNPGVLSGAASVWQCAMGAPTRLRPVIEGPGVPLERPTFRPTEVTGCSLWGATLAPMAQSFDFQNTPGHLVRRAHQRTVALFMEETAGFDVTPVQFAILHELLAQPGEDQVTLASRVAFDAATSGSVIGRLEKRGWIRREPDTRDRRRKLLWITPEGEVAALQMRDAAQRVQERLTAPLTPQESAELMVLLSKVVYNHQDPAGTSGA